VRPRRRSATARRRGTAALGCTLAALGAGLALHAGTGAGAAPETLEAQPVLGAPADTLLGASPAEAPDETWATSGAQISRYTAADGWDLLPPPVGADGQPLPDLSWVPGQLAGRATTHGAVVVAAVADGQQQLVVRDPGGAFHAAPMPVADDGTPPAEPDAVLQTGETLWPTGDSGLVLLAATEDGGRAGAFVVPAVGGGAVQSAVLRFDGSDWSREQICLGDPSRSCQAPGAGFAVLGVDASAPDNAWLLARSGSASDGIVLLRRDVSGGVPVWRPRPLAPSPYAQRTAQVTQDGTTVTTVVAARTDGVGLTVTPDGVWVDATLTLPGVAPYDATLYLRRSDGTIASWCDVPGASATLCGAPLGSRRGRGRSFAWASGDPFGQRVIVNPDEGTILTLRGTSFVRTPTLPSAGTSAAFSAPEEGWLGDVPPVHVTSQPEPNRVQPWSVPFRRPLTAIAPQPGATAGALDAQALAVGDDGQVARYTPGQGWLPEPLLSATGARARPRLRAVAWPEPGRAYAVGDHAEMWLWRADTGLWEPDPARPPNLVLPNLTGVAFDPADPSRGYAIGKQATLLRYGKEWEQETLPADLDPLANFSSIAFAGSEALVTYKYLRDNASNNPQYAGGLLVDDGGAWRIDPGAAAALGRSPPERVAGLPDGGAVVVALDGHVATRESAGAPWQPVADAVPGFPAAAAAIRDGGQVRALVATDGSGVTAQREFATDLPQAVDQPPPGQAPLLTDPYPLPSAGFLVRQTADGWRDEQHQAFPAPPGDDFPLRPDAVLALAVDPNGSQGWAVGGETGSFTVFNGDQLQTAGVMRYPADGTAPPSGTTTAPIATDAGASATFAIGGNAQCASACADLGNMDIGPDAWLPSAIANAAAVPDMRAFLYTGPGIADGARTELDDDAFARESERYAGRLSAQAGSLPVFAATTPSDLDGGGTLATFGQAFGGFGAPLGGAAPGDGVTPVAPFDATSGHYSLDSAGTAGTVRVIVLGFADGAIDDAQQCWLAQQLADAGAVGTPAIVIGNGNVGGTTTADTLVTGVPSPSAGCTISGQPYGASAYFYDAPEENRRFTLTASGGSIPAFGSGTLGYVSLTTRTETDFVGAGGFLLASVDVAGRDPGTNVAPVTARLIPNIGDLALDADDGTLLRRSQPALFEALARRPRAGMRCGTGLACSPNPYIPIPTRCQGARCASGILPTYAFASSNPDIADFVKQDPASINPRHVLLDSDDKPIPDATSGLLCAFNAGTTTVTVTTGGLAYAQKVTVQPGSVQRPCGTVPLKNPPTRAPAVAAPAPPPNEAPQPQPTGGSTPLPPPPAPHVAAKPAPHPHAHPAVPLATAFVAAAPGLTQVIPVVPPPAPTAARPIPPSGTASAQVNQSAVAPERQRSEEVAMDLVQHMVVARRTDESSGMPAYLPALVLLMAVGGATVRDARRRRGLRRRLAYVEDPRT
jgi:hypothetical protein